MRKLVLLAMAVAVVAALAAPAMASAATEWTKNNATLNTDDTIHLEGTASFVNKTLGGVHCTELATATIVLTHGTHNGTVTQFGNTNPPADCHVSGLLGSVCGENSLTEVFLKKSAALTGTAHTKILHVSEIELVNVFGSCLTLLLTGGVTAEVDNETGLTEAELSGELSTEGFGNVEVEGHLTPTASQSGVYGIATFNT